MKTDSGTLLTLASFFAVLSLFAIGGGNSAVPEMHRFSVDVQHWLTDRQFADTFALAQLTPGPNLIIVALVGFHVAGVLGAVVAMLACARIGAPHTVVFGGFSSNALVATITTICAAGPPYSLTIKGILPLVGASGGCNKRP